VYLKHAPTIIQIETVNTQSGYSGYCDLITPIILKTTVEHSKIPFALSLSKGDREIEMLTKWMGVWKPLMLRQAQHERFPHFPTAVFRIMNSRFIALVIPSPIPMSLNVCKPVRVAAD
jgi:hypothetical protein